MSTWPEHVQKNRILGAGALISTSLQLVEKMAILALPTPYQTFPQTCQFVLEIKLLKFVEKNLSQGVKAKGLALSKSTLWNGTTFGAEDRVAAAHRQKAYCEDI